jgi:hypothetical protein
MAGQPQLAGLLEFDVTTLTILNEATPDVFIPVPNIVDAGETFTLQITFTGSGPFWEFFIEPTPVIRARVTVHAEGMGGTAAELDLDPVCVDLVLGTGTYSVNYPVTGGIAQNGVYRLSAMVTLERIDPADIANITNCSIAAVPLPMVLGFTENVVLQVHEQEQL